MTPDELAARAVEAIQGGTQMNLVRMPKSKAPPGFPRGELMCENFDGTRVFSFDPVRVLKWLHKTGLLAAVMDDYALAADFQAKECARLRRELAEARKEIANACDAARDFPAHTCPASRHVQQMAEALMSGGYPMLADEPEHCAESMLATVRALWEARKDAERYRWLRSEAYVDQLEYNSWYWGTGVRAKEGRELPEDFDAAIDAAKGGA